MSAFEYKYKAGSIHKVPAQVAGETCDRLANSDGGLTPQRMVDDARPEDSPMHEEFEWDDRIAGEKYRIEQARAVIRHIVVVRSDIQTERELKLVLDNSDEVETVRSSEDEIGSKEDVQDRGFVSTGERLTKYVSLESALTNKEWRKNLLAAAMRDLQAFRLKYYRLSELAKIFSDIDDLLGA